MTKGLTAIAALLLAGCASTTGIVAIGDGIYMTAKDDYWGTSGSKVKVELYAQAAEFCAKQGKRSVPVADTGHDPQLLGANYASAEVKFRCQ